MLLIITIKLLIFTELCHSVKHYFFCFKVEKYVLTLLTKWNSISRETVHYVVSCIQIKISLIPGTESLLAKYYWTLVRNNTTHGITETQKEELITSNWKFPKIDVTWILPKFWNYFITQAFCHFIHGCACIRAGIDSVCQQKHSLFDDAKLSASGICTYVRAYSQWPIRVHFYLQGGQYRHIEIVQSQMNSFQPFISCLNNRIFIECFCAF